MGLCALRAVILYIDFLCVVIHCFDKEVYSLFGGVL